MTAVAWICCALVALVGCSRRAVSEPVSFALERDIDELPVSSLNGAPQGWPGWRGGALAGVGQTNNLPVQFNTAAGVRWTASLAGQGNSSPVVWGDRIFLTAERTVETGTRLEVTCLDRATGRRLWTNEPTTARGSTHHKNGHASATSATDGERLYVSFGSAGLFCFDFEGRQLWQTPLHTRQHAWGAASSPILFGDVVIQVCDQPERAFVAAFDAATGRQRWRTRREAAAGWSTPVIVQVTRDGEVQHELVVQGSGSSRGGGWVIGYDPLLGTEIWRVRGTTDVVCPTPIVAGGLVISTSGRNGPILAIRPGGSGDVTSTHVVWKHPRGGPYVPTGVAVGNRLYMIRDEGALACYDAASGRRIWQERLRGSFSSSLIAGDGMIYATSEQGIVYVIAADDNFKLLATNRLGERCLATPAAAGGELFIRTDLRLYCLAETRASQSLAESDDTRQRTSSDRPVAAPASANDSQRSAQRKEPAIHATPARHVRPGPGNWRADRRQE